MRNNMLATFLILLVLISMLPQPVSSHASNQVYSFSDMPNNWSYAALQKSVENGLLKGYEAGDKLLIKADAPLKRAEIAAIINRAFRPTNTLDLKGVSDISPNAWYRDDMAKAAMMGTFVKDTNMRPDSYITRQEAFVVLARAFNIVPSSMDFQLLDSFKDKNEISFWAEKDIYAMAEAGYIQGSKYKINPRANMSRAEFAVVMDKLVQHYIDGPGDVSGLMATGSVILRSPDTKLKDSVIKGDLYITDGAGGGNITLDNVTVQGRTIVCCDKDSSILIRRNSKISPLIVDRTSSTIRISAKSGSEIERIRIKSNHGNAIVEGVIKNIDLEGNDITATVSDASLTTATITGDDSKIVVEKTSIAEEVLIHGNNATIDGNGNVYSVKVGANSNKSSILTPGTKIDVEKGANSITAAGGTLLRAGSVTLNNNAGTGIATKAKTRTMINNLIIDSENGARTIDTKHGSLQMTATIFPENATVKGLDWSVSDETIASINNDGLLAALDDGTVTVKAVAKDGSGKEDEVDIIITNQNSSTIPKPIILPSKTEAGNREDGISFEIAADPQLDGVTIYYTIDGKDPDETSQKYAGNVALPAPDKNSTASIIIKAIGYKLGFPCTEVAKAVITFDGAEHTFDPLKRILHAAGGHNFASLIYEKGGKIYYNQIDLVGDWKGEEEIALGAEGKISTDTAGGIHLAYTTIDEQIGYRKYNGTSWSDEVLIDSNNGGGCSKPNIATDKNGNAHITYTDTLGNVGNFNDYPDIMYADNVSGYFDSVLLYNGYKTAGSFYDSFTYPKGSMIAINESGDYCVLSCEHHNSIGDLTETNNYTVSVKSKSVEKNILTENEDILEIYNIVSIADDFLILYGNAGKVESLILSYGADRLDLDDAASYPGIIASPSIAINNVGLLVAGTDLENKIVVYQDGALVDIGEIIVKPNSIMTAINIDGSFYILYTDRYDSTKLLPI